MHFSTNPWSSFWVNRDFMSFKQAMISLSQRYRLQKPLFCDLAWVYNQSIPKKIPLAANNKNGWKLHIFKKPCSQLPT